MPKTKNASEQPDDKNKKSNIDRRKQAEARLKALGLSSSSLKMGGDFTKDIPYVPTGIPEVDLILGDFEGIPEGSVVQIVGSSGSGKTHIALNLMGNAQKEGYVCAFMNVENAFYAPRAAALGLDPNDSSTFELYENIQTAEEYAELVYALVESKEYGVIVVDSITAMIPKVIFDKKADAASKIGAHASFIGEFVKKLTNLCASTKTICILINQFRFGSGLRPNTFMKKPTGGEALEFYCHLILEVNKINGADGQIFDNAKELIGGKSRVKITKNRFGTRQETIMPIMFTDGQADPLSEFLMKAKNKKYEYIKESRNKFRYVHPDTGEVIETKDLREFMMSLIESPAPSQRTKGDGSTTVFEYICGRIKMSPEAQSAIINRIMNSNVDHEMLAVLSDETNDDSSADEEE